MKSKTGSQTNVVQRLQDSGIRPSYQRLRIYEYLLANPTHPTADTIFSGLVGDIPTLSKTTVYNTLGLFAEEGIVSTITIEEKENRYDADTSMHGHFKCEKCGKLSDFGLDKCDLCEKNLKEFEIRFRHVYFRGLCEKCRK